MTTVHRGHIFHITGNPGVQGATDHLAHFSDGALAVDDSGIITFCGDWADLPQDFASATVVDHHDAFLLPGFIDTHMHYPQVWLGDSYGGGQLLEWLNNCIFPGESRFADPDFAQRAAIEWCDRMIKAGTTNGLVFGSAFSHAQDFLFEEANKRGLRIVSGHGIQTTGPASAKPLMVSETEAIDMTRNEIEKWHPLDAAERRNALAFVAVVPRFSLSVTPTTLAGWVGRWWTFTVASANCTRSIEIAVSTSPPTSMKMHGPVMARSPRSRRSTASTPIWTPTTGIFCPGPKKVANPSSGDEVSWPTRCTAKMSSSLEWQKRTPQSHTAPFHNGF